MRNTTPKYRIAQDILYTALLLAWTNCKNNLSAFAARFTFYTSQFVDDAIKAVNDARAIRDKAQREEARRTTHTQLEKWRDTCRNLWQFEKEYIENAFPTDDHKNKLDAAGYAFYEKSKGENWNAVNHLMDSGSTFLTDNKAILVAQGGMPDTFQADDFDNAKDKFAAYYTEYLQFDTNSETGTADKIEANNEVFDEGMKMLSHGQRIFADDEKKKALFVWDNLVEQAGLHHQAGVRGKLTDGDTGLPIKGGTLSNETKEHNAITNDDGNYHLKGLGEGKDKITAEAPGYTKASHDIDLKAAETTTIDIKLFKTP